MKISWIHWIRSKLRKHFGGPLKDAVMALGFHHIGMGCRIHYEWILRLPTTLSGLTFRLDTLANPGPWNLLP